MFTVARTPLLLLALDEADQLGSQAHYPTLYCRFLHQVFYQLINNTQRNNCYRYISYTPEPVTARRHTPLFPY
jgi:hypothetical protein